MLSPELNNKSNKLWRDPADASFDAVCVFKQKNRKEGDPEAVTFSNELC